LKNVGAVSRFIKKIKDFLQFWHFLRFLRIVCVYEKSWIGSMDHRTKAGFQCMVDSRSWSVVAA
jgi:hypothetical protein